VKEVTIGRLLLEDATPAPLRHHLGALNGKGIKALFGAAAETDPEGYRAFSKKMADLSNEAGFESGGYSFGPEHMVADPETASHRDKFRARVKAILSDPAMTTKMRDAELVRASLEHADLLQESVLRNGLAARNPLALQVESGAKGKAENLKALIAGDTLYTDSQYRPIPYPIMHSFSEGLRPHEYAAGSYGARLALTLTKLGTASGGYLAKRLNNMAHRLVVTAHDNDRPDPTVRGYPVALTDPDNEGALLAHPAGGYDRNTVLTRDVINDLKKAGVSDILVRSPLVGGPADGGVYGRDVGVRERQRIAPKGDYVGLAAGQSLCLAAGTLVRMADGTTKAIETVNPGDFVIGCSVSGVVKPVRVVRRYDNGVKTVYETVFRRGTGKVADVNMLRMRSTLDHKLLAVTVEKGTKNRRPAAHVRAVNVPENPLTRYYAKLSTSFDDAGMPAEPAALALGLILGNGCITGGVTSNGIGFSTKDDKLVADVQDYLLSTFDCRFVPQSTYGEYRLSRGGGAPEPGTAATDIRNPVRQRLVDWGLWGKYAHEKFVPVDVHHWDNASVASLLAGLVATDGFVSSTPGGVTVGYSSTSKQLVESVRYLLAVRFGVQSSAVIESDKPHPNGGSYRTCYAIAVNGWENVNRLRETFNSLCPIPGRKGLLLSELCAKWERGSKVPEIGRCAFVSQTLVGDVPTYDIEVDHPDHLFLLDNGLVVSNSEPLTQMLISSKHSGGVAGGTKGQQGFPVIDRLFSIPSEFAGGAVHAKADGRVDAIREAPQGGHYITVGGEQHYAHPDRAIVVKQGDHIEEGDELTDGTPNPAEFVAAKGIGEGRRKFVNTFLKVANASGFYPNRRNVELIARGYIDHVRLDREVGDGVPGDIVGYHWIENSYEPREGHVVGRPAAAVGHYLERPVLHYTVGTKIRKSMLPEFDKWGVKEVTSHPEAPPFHPVVIRSQDIPSHDPDPFTRQLGSGLEKSLLRGVHRGAVADTAGSSYVTPLAEGVNFGLKGLSAGWDPNAPALK